MPKSYVKLRVGLLDHLPEFAEQPDALLVYVWCLLQAPMSGPEAGCVRIQQRHLSHDLGWDRARVSRALRWLQMHPSIHHPMLVLVEKGAKNRPGRYAIPRFETTENRGRFGGSPATNRHGFVSHSAAQAQRIAGFVSHSAALLQQNNNKNARVRENKEFLEQEGAQVYEDSEWITVRDEAGARQALLQHRGYAMLPESMRDEAVENALRNLEFYRIRILDDPEPKAAVG